MCLVFTVLCSFAIGFFVKARLLSAALYLSLFSLVFSMQTLHLLMDWFSGSEEAFGAAPSTLPTDYDLGSVLGYCAVNLIIATIGTGLVVLGARIGTQRSARRDMVEVG